MQCLIVTTLLTTEILQALSVAKYENKRSQQVFHWTKDYHPSPQSLNNQQNDPVMNIYLRPLHINHQTLCSLFKEAILGIMEKILHSTSAYLFFCLIQPTFPLHTTSAIQTMQQLFQFYKTLDVLSSFQNIQSSQFFISNWNNFMCQHIKQSKGITTCINFTSYTTLVFLQPQ